MGKYETLNSGPLNFSETDMWMTMFPESPDGKIPRHMGYSRKPRAIEFRNDGVEFNVYAPEAHSVEVGGTHITRWGEEKHPLQPVGDGWW